MVLSRVDYSNGPRNLGYSETREHTLLVRRVSREDAQDALALAEALLDYLYVFSAQFAEFKQRRNQRNTDQTSENGATSETAK